MLSISFSTGHHALITHEFVVLLQSPVVIPNSSHVINEVSTE